MLDRRVEKITLAIKTYSRAYNRLEKIQREEAEHEDCLIPRGDQKTGPIGEFWVSLYLRHRYPKAKVLINPNINAPYDMEVRRKGHKPVRIQVKTVSHWSDSRVLSWIKSGHDELHIMELDGNWIPRHYWIVRRGAAGRGKRPESFEDREEIDLEWTQNPDSALHAIAPRPATSDVSMLGRRTRRNSERNVQR